MFKFETISRFLNDVLTEPDGVTYCVIRVAFGTLTFALIACEIYSIFRGNPFNAIEFGTGASSLLVSGGAGVGFKTRLGSDAPPCPPVCDPAPGDATQKPQE